MAKERNTTSHYRFNVDQGRVKRLLIPTGCSLIDRFLEGGLSSGKITLLYGEAETGKTTLAIQCSVNTARMGYKTIFVDSDGAFTPERLAQIARRDLNEISEEIILFRPLSFEEQGSVIDHLREYLTERFGLIVVDSVTSLYRRELKGDEGVFPLNRELNRQVATLRELSKEAGIPILLTSQVRSVPTPEGGDVAPVATRVLTFWSDYVIHLKRTMRRGIISAALEKPKGRIVECRLIIVEDGIRDYER